MANMWVKKSIASLKAEAEASDEHSGLRLTLTATNLVTLGIGAIIGEKFHTPHGWTVLTETLEKYLVQSKTSFESSPSLTGIINIPAMVIVGLVTMLLVLGVQESARVNNVIVFIKVTIVVLFIILG